MKHLILIIIITTFSIGARATELLTGYVVTANNDTIKCKIKFKTVELTELNNTGEKINYSLTLYKPGRYDIADPDLYGSDLQFVNLKCSSVGIGYFKELYEGGDDVYY